MKETNNKEDKINIETEKEETKVDGTIKQIKKLVTTEHLEFLNLIKKPFRLIWINFLIGLARGLGIAIGMTILAAFITYFSIQILLKMVDLPIIGEWVAKVVSVVRQSLSNAGQ